MPTVLERGAAISAAGGMGALTREQAIALDAIDPLAPYRDHFLLRDGLIYLDGNSLGPLPRRTVERLGATVREQWGEGLITSWLAADWVRAPQRSRPTGPPRSRR